MSTSTLSKLLTSCVLLFICVSVLTWLTAVQANTGQLVQTHEQIKLSPVMQPEVTHINYAKNNTKNYAKVKNAAVSNTQWPQEAYYIIQLTDAPIIKSRAFKQMKAITKLHQQGRQLTLSDKNAQRQLQQQISLHHITLAKQRDAVMKRIQARFSKVAVQRYYDTVFNGIAIKATAEQAENIQQIKGIKRVYKNNKVYPKLDRSHDVINSATAWALAGGRADAGKNIKVAIIDSGIRPTHPMFSGSGFSAPDLSGNSHITNNPDYCRAVDATFCNNKLIIARYSNPTFAIYEDEHLSPLGFDGHGTHVAGIAVGNEVTAPFANQSLNISGVAPGAYLLVYKALFASAGDATDISGDDVMLLEALDHAVKDGADVINNSWGGGAGGNPATSVYRTVFEDAEAAGVVVVSAAGNEGSGTSTISCPGCIEAGITVGNTTHGRFFSNVVTLAGVDYLAVEGSNNLLTSNLNLPLIAAKQVDSNNELGCNAFPAGAFDNAIALVSRGVCLFTEKAANARAAGADAIIIYNNVASAPFTMTMDESLLPAVMVSQQNGEKILEQLSQSAGQTAFINASTTRVIDEFYSDNLVASSSRGPNTQLSFLKPDIVAPGGSILSAISPEDPTALNQDYALLTGTSMASPHVAGAAAVLKQLKPNWNAKQIKSALMSTSDFINLVTEDSETVASLFDRGAGRLNLGKASQTNTTFNKASYANSACISACSVVNSVTNHNNVVMQWSAVVIMDDDEVNGTVSPADITLSSNQTLSFTTRIDTSTATEAKWYFGRVQFTSTTGLQRHIPIVVFATESNNNAVVNTFTTDPQPLIGENVPITAELQNAGYKGNITFEVATPTEAEFVNNTLQVNVERGSTTSQSQTSNKLQWQGLLDAESLTVEPDATPWGNIPLSGFGAGPVACANGCDDFSFSIDFNFSYNGQSYSQLVVSDNGLVIPGGNQDLENASTNQLLPSFNAPNNVIAPLWADFDLDEAGVTDSGGGVIRQHILQSDGKQYLVVEWDKVRLYSEDNSETDEYSFQVIVEENTDNIWFNYLALPQMPNVATVGAENSDGTVGVNYYHNTNYPATPSAPSGSTPILTGAALAQSGFSLELKKLAGGKVTLSYQLQSNSTNNYTKADMLIVEENASGSINVLSNDDATAQVTVNATATLGTLVQEASQLIVLAADGGLDASSLSLTQLPQYGQAEITSAGVIKYTPNAGFSGIDTLRYQVSDQQGRQSNPTDVSITVENLNNAPVLTAGSAVTVAEGGSITLTISASDDDGDTLSFNWQQTSGPAVSLATDGNTATFIAPQVTTNTTLQFSVTANDGTSDSNTVTLNVTVTNTVSSGQSGGGSSGGSIGYWLLMWFLLYVSRQQLCKAK
ncbi:S8 family serine peptidase [Flocculibacter collagenilyticus]|uniref:S8 family serine peptidase n=1 Tax=Flocculibacter collagenilyticus TaxID=2744479 RepID=UPI0018F2F049|nr:S8 family serine peptidase [Flocculibacter collagenilyticus]